MGPGVRGADFGCGARGEVGDFSLSSPFYPVLVLWKHFSAVWQGKG